VAKYVQGFYNPINPEKYIGNIKEIVYRSSWELRAFKWADLTDNILEWSSEPFPIRYFDYSTNKTRRYFPDLYLKIKTKEGIKRFIVEIKPEKQTKPPKQGRKKTKTFIQESLTYEKNVSKWSQAEKFCKDNDMTFMVISEKELGIK
jgi:hypothetical protein